MKRYLRVLSRHPSHQVLRSPKNKSRPGKGLLLKFKSVIRLGSTSPSNIPIQINSIEAVKNSSNKLLMKECFKESGVKTADWDTLNNFINFDDEGIVFKEQTILFPIVIKHIYGSRNNGNTLISDSNEFVNWLENKTFDKYIIEKYHTHKKEYRLHVTKHGCFYTNRKMLKTDATERWFRNDSNSIWVLENNELFDKPKTWNIIVEDCVKAINSVGLDVGACDVKVNNKGKHIVIEVNSAPSFGKITEEKYREIIPVLVNDKVN